MRTGLPSDLIEAARRYEIVGTEFQKKSISGLAMAWAQAVAGGLANSGR